MPNFSILYDEPQEADWFRDLHPAFSDSREEAITRAQKWPNLGNVLAYDRPDIILMDGDTPILVVEETVEVPSGHNVGQRFARIAAAAEAGLPCLYFGPYVAKKHGGATAGPRFMNVRLFHALDAMERITHAAITTINWPVDTRFEVRRDPAKDDDVREYVQTFLQLYNQLPSLAAVNRALICSPIHVRMVRERTHFVTTSIKNPAQYDAPPSSVEILSLTSFAQRHPGFCQLCPGIREVVLYNVGMTYIRSDPYTGMAMLYRYLYILEHSHRALVLWFPNITMGMWRTASANSRRKDIRMFRIAADAVVFSDGLLSRAQL